ncbi:hypothetical protein Rsub_10206 [Raphidocelis subcapitata]|uniref:Rab-GAP TBC domain-containing protein n=1 Tax=Raphidocelis subcapitata TaxID=307507 RepID=A0A2V0PD52_9CHLO|nr:hypothetical protein Rsub_10206 [Raphidocelis subcapitata]|eukprot:GBF97781.1 hypothetical protein Rsub_10206 [Raphidocelis subcapitata]
MRPRYRAYHSSARGPGGGLAAAGGLAYGVGGLALAAAAVAAAAVAYSSMAQRQRRRIGLSRAQWEAAVDDAGALVGFDALVSEIAQRGLEPEARADVWPFLLGVFSPDSTFAERRLQHALMVQQHQQLLLQCQALEAALRDCARADGDAGAPPGTPSPPPAAHLPAAAAAAMAQAQQSPRGGGGGGAAAGLPPPELPAQVVAFAEAHRIIVIDAVRTDFRRASVAAVYASDAPAAAAAPAATGPAPPGADDRPGPPPGAGSTLLGPAAPADPLLASWVSGWLSCHPGGVWGPVQRLWVSEAAAAVLEGSAHLAPEGRRQAARLIALLSAYAVYDPETGYCQG